MKVTRIFELKDNSAAALFHQYYHQQMPYFEEKFSTALVHRGNSISLTGEKSDVEKCFHFIRSLTGLQSEEKLTDKEIERLMERVLSQYDNPEDIFREKIEVWSQKKHIMPKTEGQAKYVSSIRESDITVCFGPAGTGKTYLAMAMAVEQLKKEKVTRIILTRPAVEAGEALGFLPGDLKEKLSPYLRPLYDALFEMIEAEKVENFIEKGIIEIAPLAYMRGRTLNDSFIILDEAQNSSSLQMKMFLTRLGFNSKIVITGDITQIDLRHNQKSGLVEVKDLLKNIDGISVVQLTGKDIIRHRLVQEIIKAYKRAGRKNED
jgi:phosphate starvation-inducible protein PhoH and related proteins